MNVLGVCLSPRKEGNSEILLREALRGAEQAGAGVEFLSIRKMNLKPCSGCLLCRRKGECSIDDDMQSVYPKLTAADGIIFASPVYFWSLPGGAKSFLDRTYALRFPRLRLMNKLGASICVASSNGNTAVSNIFQRYFISNNMIATYSVSGYAMERGTIRKHKHAMLTAFELGRLVPLMIANGFRYPDEFDQPLYVYVKDKYGVHMSPYENE